ncbi:hypothetical protein Cpir12675_005378 [Ceratocystis pirilliformis]|uniref:histidine kinase n=1 Tax=Ceratocystis pirilliformis TaxID=259994 RepID=A0ABR3YQ34_9PEZI
MLSPNTSPPETVKSSASSPFLQNGQTATIGSKSNTPRLSSFKIPSTSSDLSTISSDSPTTLEPSTHVSLRDSSFTLKSSAVFSQSASSDDQACSYSYRPPDEYANEVALDDTCTSSTQPINEENFNPSQTTTSKYLFLGTLDKDTHSLPETPHEISSKPIRSVQPVLDSVLQPSYRYSASAASAVMPPSLDQMMFSAFHSLPVSVMVLNDGRSVAFTNDAMNNLLSSVLTTGNTQSKTPKQNPYCGLLLSQIGIFGDDSGHPRELSWGAILNHVATKHQPPTTSSGDQLISDFTTHLIRNNQLPDFTIDVIFTKLASSPHSSISSDMSSSSSASTSRVFISSPRQQIHAKVIVTTWLGIKSQRFFTLTFPKVEFIPQKDPQYNTSSSQHSLNNEPFASQSFADFPFLKQPSREKAPISERVSKLKDAIIDNTNMPIVGIWKDGSVAYPNKAARSMFGKHIMDNRAYYVTDLMGDWVLWNGDFTEQLPRSEYPMRFFANTLKPFEGKRIGLIRDSGQRVVYDVVGEVIHDMVTGEFLGGVVSYRDVTRMAEDITRFQKSGDERFRTICDSMPQLVWAVHPDGFPYFFNRQWYEYTGLTREECQHYWIQDVIHPEDEPEALGKWAQCLETGEPFQAEYRFRSCDGSFRWFLSRALPLRSFSDGPITGWFGTSTDVHDAVITKRIAECTKEQLKSVMAHAKVTLFTVDRELKITLLEGGLVGNGIPDDTDANGRGWFIGHDVYEVFDGLVKLKPDEENGTFLRPIESVLMGNDPEHVMEHKINGRWYRTRFVPMYSSDTPSGSLQEDKKNDVIDGVIGVIMDITEHHAAIEEETKRMQQAVANEQAAKEATRLKSQFLANMSHEFRTPIQWVLGYTDILDSTPMNKEQEQLVATIRNSATILLTLINDILDFSKIESGKMALDEVDFDLCSVLRETTEMRRFEAKNKQIDFIQVCAPGVNGLKLVGDSNRLRQILNNVLDNSVKFTREGFVLLRVEIESEMTEIINLRFIIQDSGVGIESGKQGHIFEPFHQADASTAREFGGTGLGLSICKSFLDLMHGYINLTSKHGRGTTAIIDIPFRKRLKPCDDEACHVPNSARNNRFAIGSHRIEVTSSRLARQDGNSESKPLRPSGLILSQSESLAARPKQSMTQLARRRSVATTHKIPMPRENINILLVEDNPLNAKLMIKLLGQINFKSCSHMVNGKEALDFIDRAQRGVECKPDLILMDCQMPILDGYQCAEALRNDEKYCAYIRDVPIIAVTASAIVGDREKCLKSGMNGYLLKPVTQSMLERSIIEWLMAWK